ncbi:MAG: rhodanese-like domain-containing protein [Agriterribacter sp.]
MFNILKKALGMESKADLKKLVENGALIIDVRTQEEYATGNIRGSQNIPLGILQQNLSKFKKDKPVITCCASGMRSASAKTILQSNGFTEVYNGGGWMNLQKKIS